jgi:hypothetical protein
MPANVRAAWRGGPPKSTILLDDGTWIITTHSGAMYHSVDRGGGKFNFMIGAKAGKIVQVTP